MTDFWFLLGFCVWISLAALAAPVIGRSIRNADRRKDDDLMALVQPESLSPAERDRQVIERSWLL